MLRGRVKKIEEELGLDGKQIDTLESLRRDNTQWCRRITALEEENKRLSTTLQMFMLEAGYEEVTIPAVPDKVIKGKPAHTEVRKAKE